MKRIKELDGIRGLAILLVLAYHYFYNGAVIESPLGNQLLKFLLGGWSGVDLFFVLSGFLIVGILIDTKGSSNYFSTFYIRRALRILPLYYLLLALFLILPHFVSNEELFKLSFPFWIYPLFAQNFFMINFDFGTSWLGVTWSLAIEEQFYLLLPLLVLKLNKRRLIHVFICLIAIAPILRVLFDGLGGYIFTFARSDAILAGGLFAIAYRDQKIKSFLTQNINLMIVLFFIFLLGTGALMLKGGMKIGDAFSHLWLGILYCQLLAICVLRPNKITNLFISNQILIWLGTRSYSIYLFHLPVIILVHQFLIGRTSPYYSNWFEFFITLLAMFITFLFAELSFRFFESFFLSYGKKFQYKTDQNKLSDRKDSNTSI